jgi:hypothetical protein
MKTVYYESSDGKILGTDEKRAQTALKKFNQRTGRSAHLQSLDVEKFKRNVTHISTYFNN